MNLMQQMASFLVTPLMVAASWCIGPANAAPEGDCIAIRQQHSLAHKLSQGAAHTVLASSPVSATLWKVCTHQLQLNWIMTRMGFQQLR